MHNRKPIQSLKDIINSLKISGLSHIDQNKIKQINDRIKELPSPELLDQLANKPDVIEKIQEEVGKIMRLIEIHSKRDDNSKVQYKALTGLEPRYNILKMEPIMNTASTTNAIKELVKLSETMDIKGHSLASTQLIQCAKNVKTASKEELSHHINLIASNLEKEGFKDDAMVIKEAGIGDWMAGAKGAVQSLGNIKNMMLDSFKLSQIQSQIKKSMDGLKTAYDYILAESPKVKNQAIKTSIETSSKELGAILTSGNKVYEDLNKIKVSYQATEKEQNSENPENPENVKNFGETFKSHNEKAQQANKQNTQNVAPPRTKAFTSQILQKMPDSQFDAHYQEVINDKARRDNLKNKQIQPNN